MYHLGVDTTRALSLVVSDGGEMAERPWQLGHNTSCTEAAGEKPECARIERSVVVGQPHPRNVTTKVLQSESRFRSGPWVMREGQS